MKINIPNQIQEQIQDLLEGRLSEEQSDKLWAQLIQNPNYTEYMKTAAAFHHAAKDIAPDAPEEATRAEDTEATIWPLFTKAAASLLLVIGIIGLLYIIAPNESDELTPLAMIELDNVRSAQDYSGSEHLLQTAISHSVNGEHGVALRLTEQIMDNPESVEQYHEANILAGIIYYNQGEFVTASEIFARTAYNDEAPLLLVEQGYWYQANAMLHLGNEDEALELMRKVVELDGAFSRIAKQFVQ